MRKSPHSTTQEATLREAGEHAQLEIAWAFARDCWGLGYASEAGAACRDHGFATLHWKRIAAVIQHGNDQSVAVARRLGMQHEQDIRTGALHRDAFGPSPVRGMELRSAVFEETDYIA